VGADARLQAVADAKSDAALAAILKERDDALSEAKGANANLTAIQAQLDAAKAAVAKADAALAAALKERDDALSEAKRADADLAARQRQLDTAKAAAAKSDAALATAAKERDDALSEAKRASADLAASQRQLDAAKAAAAKSDEARAVAVRERDGWYTAWLARVDAKDKGTRPGQALPVTPGSGKSFRDCNDGCPEMVVVPAADKAAIGEGGSAREISIGQPFAVGKFEVTFDEWQACVAGGGCTRHPNPADSGWGRGRRPVIDVTWDEAKEYVAWLSGKTRKTYRLLSEAEWEYAARAGTTTAYAWGEQVGTGNANCVGCGSQWDNKQTAPVGSFSPNKWGLHDMHGNVWEWCEDDWREGDASFRVVRGGAWDDKPGSLRSTSRGKVAPDKPTDGVGFRVARTLAR
jgi:formylglycine-generating enzyme required for sulfatase activity